MNRVKLPEVCELIMGQSPDSTSYNKSKEGLAFYQGNANFGPKYPTPTVWCSVPKKIARNNDILISVRAPIGDLNFANEECCIGRGLAALRIKDNSKYSKEYLFAFLKSIARELQRKGTGSTFTAIGKTVLEDLELNVPSLPEQQNIAAHLDLIQSAIDNKKQQLQQLDELVKSKFVEMFGENPVESGKWKVETLGDVCSSIVRGPFGSALKKEFFVPKSNDTVKVYEQKHAIQKSADIGTYYVTKEKYEELKRFECKPGDFLMSCSGTMGEFYQLPGGCEKGIINQALCKFTLNEKMEPLFFYEWMKHSIHNLETRGSGIKNVAAVSFVKQMPMILPSKEIQNEYVSYVQKIDSVKTLINAQLIDLHELLNSKMDEYFGGE